MVKKNNISKKVASLATAGMLAAGAIGVGVGFALDNPETIVEERVTTETVTEYVDVPGETITVEKEVQVEVEVEVEKIVEVDNGKLDEILNHLYDRDGNVEYITDELDRDEIQEIADAIDFVNTAIAEGADYIKDELADEIDREIVGGEELDEDDVERIKVRDDLDEVTISDYNHEDKDVEITYDVKFEHDDVDYTATVVVEYRDGKLDDMEVSNIQEA